MELYAKICFWTWLFCFICQIFVLTTEDWPKQKSYKVGVSDTIVSGLFVCFGLIVIYIL